MKIAIIGASGQTGTELIAAALAKGHEIIGVARTPENIASNDPRVTKRKGDAFDEQSIIDGVEGADVVRDGVDVSTRSHAGPGQQAMPIAGVGPPRAHPERMIRHAGVWKVPKQRVTVL